jgi:hypothetical protein
MDEKNQGAPDGLEIQTTNSVADHHHRLQPRPHWDSVLRDRTGKHGTSNINGPAGRPKSTKSCAHTAERLTGTLEVPPHHRQMNKGKESS